MVREAYPQQARHPVSVGYGGAHGQLSTELEVRRRLAALDRQTTGPVTTSPAVQPVANNMEDDDCSSPFECNICLEMSRDPVVTYCGHLYCWPCLYRWLQVDGKCRSCPVCKASVSQDTVVPIYGRGAEVSHDPRDGEVKNIPARPSGKAPSTGIFSMFFGSSQSPPSLMNSIFILEEEINSPEHQHQAILARLLLMLGSFVIMFLLLI